MHADDGIPSQRIVTVFAQIAKSTKLREDRVTYTKSKPHKQQPRDDEENSQWNEAGVYKKTEYLLTVL